MQMRILNATPETGVNEPGRIRFTMNVDLPNGLGSTTSEVIDMGPPEVNVPRLVHVQFELTVPALGPDAMPVGKSMSYDLLLGDDENLSSPNVYANIMVQWATGGDGVSKARHPFKLPTHKRYMAIRCNGSAEGDASGSKVTLTASW